MGGTAPIPTGEAWKNETCGTCVCWIHGHCYRFPPVHMKDNQGQVRPIVSHKEQACGEHHPTQSPAPDGRDEEGD